MFGHKLKECGRLAAVMILWLPAASAELVAGRVLPPERDARAWVAGGSIVSIEGTVRETSRLYYEVTGQQENQLLREDYDLGDFGMDSGYPTFGMATETAWKYFTLQCDFLLLDLDTESTAVRNYYIGVGSVEFGGQDYEYMKIAEGQPFSAEFTGAKLDLCGLITPFTFRAADNFCATPWLSVGMFLAAGSYELDAGPATGLVQYQNPSETFVVGGRADGFVGAGLPEIGLGGELRFGSEGAPNLVVQANYAVCRYNGGTGWLTTASHREKDVDLDHTNIKAICAVEIPMRNGRTVSIGVQLQAIDTEAKITSQGGTTEEIIAQRERFDKDVDFRMVIVTGAIGLRF